MQRVLIIGSPGAGKSTLSHAVAARTGLSLYHMDKIHWLAGWVERDRDEGLAEVKQVLAQERWIIDGNYGSSLPLRIERADTVVWLDYPTWRCLGRALKRLWRHRGQTRPDMTEGCPERLDTEFFLYILMFRSGWHRRNGQILADFAGQVIRFHHPREAEHWLEGLGSQA